VLKHYVLKHYVRLDQALYHVPPVPPAEGAASATALRGLQTTAPDEEGGGERSRKGRDAEREDGRKKEVD